MLNRFRLEFFENVEAHFWGETNKAFFDPQQQQVPILLMNFNCKGRRARSVLYGYSLTKGILEQQMVWFEREAVVLPT